MMGTKLPVRWHSGSEIIDPEQWVEEGAGAPRRFVRPDLPPGSARLSESASGQPFLTFTCPCGCGMVGCLPLCPMPKEKGWQWDGDRVFPTLTPSILKTSACRWHGLLTKGVWETTP